MFHVRLHNCSAWKVSREIKACDLKKEIRGAGEGGRSREKGREMEGRSVTSSGSDAVQPPYVAGVKVSKPYA